MGFELKKDPKKFAICGTGSGWEALNPRTNLTVYCLNDFIKIERYQIKPDRLFIMDVLDEKPQIVAGLDNLGDVISRINSLKVPLVAPYKYKDIPLSEAFPLQKAVERFGLPYFTNTICYMICYALLEGAEEINVYGVNQASSSEYADERGGVEYWLGVANGLGVKVIVHGNKSQLLRYRGRAARGMMYGYFISYEEVMMREKKIGRPIIKQLLPPQKIDTSKRTIR